MKIIASKELVSRISNAAANGSVVAKGILGELKKDASVAIRGSANYFSTKRIKSSRDTHIACKIVFTGCSKDTKNPNFPDRNNPQAPWFPDNRTDYEPSTFASLFKNLPDYGEKDLGYFISAITLDSRVSVKMYDRMSDIEFAYNECNYTTASERVDTSLHNSCMRYEKTASRAADFYHNFAGAGIIIAKDSSNNVLGRAIVWKNTYLEKEGVKTTMSVLDRVYYSHQFVVEMIYDYARKMGIGLRKRFNDYEHARSFVALNPVEVLDLNTGESVDQLKVSMPAKNSRWYKSGVPYLDTFSEIILDQDGTIILTNKCEGKQICSCRTTIGVADRQHYYCPLCGKLHKETDPVNGDLCRKCSDELLVPTIFGRAFTGRVKKYDGVVYPSVLFDKGRPKNTLSLYLQLQKLF